MKNVTIEIPVMDALELERVFATVRDSYSQVSGKDTVYYARHRLDLPRLSGEAWRALNSVCEQLRSRK